MKDCCFNLKQFFSFVESFFRFGGLLGSIFFSKEHIITHLFNKFYVVGRVTKSKLHKNSYQFEIVKKHAPMNLQISHKSKFNLATKSSKYFHFLFSFVAKDRLIHKSAVIRRVNLLRIYIFAFSLITQRFIWVTVVSFIKSYRSAAFINQTFTDAHCRKKNKKRKNTRRRLNIEATKSGMLTSKYLKLEFCLFFYCSFF